MVVDERSQEIRVGEKIRELRERKGVSLQELGERAGYSSALISQIENHLISPPLGAMIKIAKALEVKVGAFFGEDPRESFTIVRKNERRLTSRFASKEGAFGFFTKRVVADGDPVRSTLTELHAGARGALGSGVAYVFRGEYLAELSYTNEAETPDQMRDSGKRVLPGVAVALGDRLPGDTSLPPAVAALPVEHRLPMGVSYVIGNVLDIAGLGSGAIGYYQDGEKRWRVLCLGRADDDAAGDVLETIKKIDRASTLKELPFPALAFSNQQGDSAPRTEWVAGRKGGRVFGVGDEELVLGAGRSKADEERVKLTRDEKIAILKKLVSGG